MKQPTYMRQRYLLSFVGQLGVGGVSCTNLQKLIFLNEQNSGVFYYDFIPYKYGPYSFQLAIQDVHKKYFDDFAKTKDIYFFMETTKKWHNVSPNPFVIIGVFPPPFVTN